MKRIIFSFMAVFFTIPALADGPEYFRHVRGLYEQGRYEEAIQGFDICKWLYFDELSTQNMDEWITKCNKGIEDRKAAAAAKRARAAAAERAAYEAKQSAREDNKLVYITCDALNLNGVEFDLASVIINDMQKQTNLIFTTNPDDAFYYVYVSALSRTHNFDKGNYYSNVVANVRVTNMKDALCFANKFEETQGSTLNYEKATELCYSSIGEKISEDISTRIGGIVTTPRSNEKKAIAVVVSSNFINTSDLDFVELQFRNAFHKVDYEVKKPASGIIADLRTKAIAYQEAGNVSNSEAHHITEKTGADLLCVVVINRNTTFNTYNFTASTVDLEKGTTVGLEAFYSMQEDRIHNQNAVLEAAGELIKGMELTTDETVLSKLDKSITEYHEAYKRDLADVKEAENIKKNHLDKEYKNLIARSFVPGLSQIKDGAKGLGITFIAGETVCVGGIVISQYFSSLYASQINSTHNATEKQRLAQMANICNVTTYVSAAGAVGLYVWSLVDGLSRAKRQNPQALIISPYSNLESFGFTLAYNF